MPFDLERWLSDVGLPQYIEELRDWDEETLPTLSEAELEKLGVGSMPHRRKLLLAIGRLGQGQQSQAAAPLPQDPGAAMVPSLAPPPDRALSLFISYGRDEYKDEAAALSRALTERGHQVWFDQSELREGIQWEYEIEKGLRASEWVILLMTPHSVRRPDGFCLKEITKAAELNRKIVPVLLSDVPGGAPLLICNVQYLDWRSAVPSSQRGDLFQQMLARLCKAVERNELNFEGQQGQLLAQLKPLDFLKDQRDRAAGFMGREWLLKEVDRWLQQDGSRLFWLSGGPGIGKSAFAAHLCQTHPDVKARHFCVHNHDERGDPRLALLSIVYQLSQQMPEYAKRLAEVDLKEEATKSTVTIFDNLVVRLLEQVSAPERPCVVVIDAIDEASRNGGNEIAAMIRDHWSRTPAWLRLLITSRPESEVINRLAGFKPWVLDAKREENLQDLRQFLRQALEKQPYAASQGAIEAAIEVIVDRSEGIFLYAKMVLEEIKAGHLSIDRLDEFPRGMAGFYSAFFDRKFRNDLARYQAQWRGALGLILAAREPLPVAVLAGAMAWQEEEFNDFVVALGSLLERQGEGAQRAIRPFHKSLPDWLSNDGHAGVYFASEAGGHKRMAAHGMALYRQGPEALPLYLLRHLPAHLAASERGDERRAVLTDFALAMQRCEQGVVIELLEDYRQHRAMPRDESLSAWADCIIASAHLLRRSTSNWPAHRVLLQMAIEHADDSSITLASEAWLQQNSCDWEWIRNPHRPSSFQRSPFVAVMTGHSGELLGAEERLDGTVLTWSNDMTVRLWNGETGEQLAKTLVDVFPTRVKSLSDGRVLISSDVDADKRPRLWDVEPDSQTRILRLVDLIELEEYFRGNTQALGLRALEGITCEGCLKGIWSMESVLIGRTDGTVTLAEKFSQRILWRTPVEGLGPCLSLTTDHLEQQFVATFGNGELQVRSVATGVLIWRRKLSEGRLLCIGFLTDGRFLSGGHDGNLSIWKTDTGDCPVWTTKVDDLPIISLSVSRDGAVATVVSKGGRLTVWELIGSPRLLASLNEDGVLQISHSLISSDGTQCAAVSQDGEVVTWNLSEKGAPRIFPKAHRGKINALAASPDWARVFTGGEDKKVCIWNTASGVCEQVLVSHAQQVIGIDVSEDGFGAISISLDGMLITWNLRAGDGFIDIRELPDGRWVSSSVVESALRIYDAPGGTLLGCIRIAHEWIHICRDGRILVGSSPNLNVLAFPVDFRTQRLETYQGSEIICINPSVEVSGDISVLVGKADGWLQELKSLSLQLAPYKEWWAHPGKRVWQVARIPASPHLVTAGWDGSVRVWNVEGGRCVGEFPGKPLNASSRSAASAPVAPRLPPFYVATVSPDGRWLVTSAGNGRTLRIWDLPAVGGAEALTLDNGRLLLPTPAEGKRRDAHALSIRAVAFEPDGLHIRVSDERGIVKRWNLVTAEEAGPALDHYQACLDLGLVDSRVRQEAYSLALSPDGRYLACGGASRAITVWDLQVESPACWRILKGPLKGVSFIAFLKDSRTLIAVSWDGWLRFWDVTSGDEQPRFCSSNRSFSKAAFAGPDILFLTTNYGELVRLDFQTSDIKKRSRA